MITKTLRKYGLGIAVMASLVVYLQLFTPSSNHDSSSNPSFFNHNSLKESPFIADSNG
jgi:hypothetical protein